MSLAKLASGAEVNKTALVSVVVMAGDLLAAGRLVRQQLYRGSTLPSVRQPDLRIRRRVRPTRPSAATRETGQ